MRALRLFFGEIWLLVVCVACLCYKVDKLTIQLNSKRSELAAEIETRQAADHEASLLAEQLKSVLSERADLKVTLVTCQAELANSRVACRQRITADAVPARWSINLNK